MMYRCRVLVKLTIDSHAARLTFHSDNCKSTSTKLRAYMLRPKLGLLSSAGKSVNICQRVTSKMRAACIFRLTGHYDGWLFQ